jgi:hypothetical protein
MLRLGFTIVNRGRMKKTKVLNGSPRESLDNRGQSVLPLEHRLVARDGS